MDAYAELYKDYMQVYRGFTLVCQGVTWRVERRGELLALAESPEAAREWIDASY